MSDMTCPTCGTDDNTRVLQGQPPKMMVRCDRCQRNWSPTIPPCDPGRHDWYDLAGALGAGGVPLRQRCRTCGSQRIPRMTP